MKRRFARTVIGFGVLTIAAILVGPLVGPTPVDFSRVFDLSIPFADNPDAQIFFIARLPRTLAGAGVGACLASAGVVFQGLLRNPLATPFTLGISAGAARGSHFTFNFNWCLTAGGLLGEA